MVRLGNDEEVAETLRTPAGNTDIDDSPISENIVRNVLERINDGSSFSDFSSTELAVVVRTVFEELEAAETDIDFSAATSVEDAASQADDGSGDADDQLVEDSKGDSGTELTGNQNLANFGVGMEANGQEALISTLSESIPAEFVAGPGLDFSGKTITEFDTVATWNFQDPSTFDFPVDQSGEDITAPDDESSRVFISVGKSGRLLTAEGARGPISSDGDRFVFAGTDENDFANIVFGGGQWSPPDNIDETFNIVNFTTLFDNSRKAV